jgi:Flp pilus assembly protein TadG
MLLVPVLFVIALIAVQAGVVLHGISVANHVAAQGAMAAARHGAPDDSGIDAVYDTTTALGARLARPPEIVSSRDEVIVRVWVRLPRAVPFFAETVSRQAVVPRERYIPYAER